MARGEYSIIRRAFWNDPDVKRGLEPGQKLLLLYYFTSQHANLIGLYSCPFMYASSETGLDPTDVQEWTMGALSKFVTYDLDTEEVWVHAAGTHQVGPALKMSDNRKRKIEGIITACHSDRLRRLFLKHYEDWPLGIEPPPEPSGRGSEGASKGLERGSPRGSEAPIAEHSITEHKEYDDKSSGDEPPEKSIDLFALDVTDDEDWATLRTTLFAPLRKHIWKGKRPPERVPKEGKWDEGRELSIMRDWVRGGLLKPHEAAEVLRVAPKVMGWTGPASLSWLAPDGNIGRIREIVGRARKGHFPSVAEVVRAS